MTAGSNQSSPADPSGSNTTPPTAQQQLRRLAGHPAADGCVAALGGDAPGCLPPTVDLATHETGFYSAGSPNSNSSSGGFEGEGEGAAQQKSSQLWDEGPRSRGGSASADERTTAAAVAADSLQGAQHGVNTPLVFAVDALAFDKIPPTAAAPPTDAAEASSGSPSSSVPESNQLAG
jgi:hypothetical protein